MIDPCSHSFARCSRVTSSRGRSVRRNGVHPALALEEMRCRRKSSELMGAVRTPAPKASRSTEDTMTATWSSSAMTGRHTQCRRYGTIQMRKVVGTRHLSQIQKFGQGYVSLPLIVGDRGQHKLTMPSPFTRAFRGLPSPQCCLSQFFKPQCCPELHSQVIVNQNFLILLFFSLLFSFIPFINFHHSSCSLPPQFQETKLLP